MKNIPLVSLIFIFCSLNLRAQDPLAEQTSSAGDQETEQRVQYTLILPEEKTPEFIKSDENNPFEVISKSVDAEGDSEENRVRDILLGMAAVGGGAGPSGMRVMLGGMRLEVGQQVPDVIPDQQVMLRVKAITSDIIELVWVEKTPTGLPPKPFVIPVDVTPNVRYLMPTNGGGRKGAATGTLRRADITASKRLKESNTASTAIPVKPVAKAVSVDDSPSEAVAVPAPTSNVPEASVLRMLFGNHGPQPK
ncbi:MAG: hypothetical protein NTV80_02415 [Verrucomicrobia bacterium]|nr:hypothetical protein [Verrucomicrobiota bacterium]